MAEEAATSSPTELLASGRRHIVMRDYSSAVEVLGQACQSFVTEYGDLADQCADVYYWYGKALLGLSREESGVLGDKVPGTNEQENENDDEESSDDGDNEANGDVAKNDDEAAVSSEAQVEKSEAQSTTKDEAATEPEPSEEAGTLQAESTNGAEDDSAVDMANDDSNPDEENEDDVDNLQLAWEMLELSRSILQRRVGGGASEQRAQLADVHLTLGEVALESETYDKACVEMMSCLEIQKQLYGGDNRRIAETHYQIGLANSLASNFEEAITHFKNAANILETRIKLLEDPAKAEEIQKERSGDSFYSVEAEIKEIKELLPEIREKIQDMMDYKAETMRLVKQNLFPSNGEGSSSSSPVSSSAFSAPSSAFSAPSSAFTSNGVASSSSSSKPAASNISHLIKRKRKSSTDEEASAPKKSNT